MISIVINHLQSGGGVACQADDRLRVGNARVVEHAGAIVENDGERLVRIIMLGGKVEHAGGKGKLSMLRKK